LDAGDATDAWVVAVDEETASCKAGEGCGAARGAVCEVPSLMLVADGALFRDWASSRAVVSDAFSEAGEEVTSPTGDGDGAGNAGVACAGDALGEFCVLGSGDCADKNAVANAATPTETKIRRAGEWRSGRPQRAPKSA
jgi:hypothetical protein